MSRKPGGDWVKAAQVENEVAASLALAVLQEAGIPCFAKPAGPGVAYFSPFVLPHFIFVPRDQFAPAKELLTALEGASKEETDEAD